MEYETESTDIFDNWLDGLKDTRAKVKMNVRISRAKKGNFGDWKTEAMIMVRVTGYIML